MSSDFERQAVSRCMKIIKDRYRNQIIRNIKLSFIAYGRVGKRELDIYLRMVVERKIKRCCQRWRSGVSRLVSELLSIIEINSSVSEIVILIDAYRDHELRELDGEIFDLILKCILSDLNHKWLIVEKEVNL